MNISQKHLIKVFITLNKVNITVRFPCSLAFSLKSQKNQVECTKMYELKNGQSIVNQTLQSNLQMVLCGGRYQEKKITLTIYMISTNGKIPAGSVNINPIAKIMGQDKLSLQKCPDRNACVFITQKFQVLTVEPLQEDNRGLQLVYSASRQNSMSGNKIIQKGFQSDLNSSVADILRRSRQSRQNSSLSKEQNTKFKFSEVYPTNRVPVVQTERRNFSKSRADLNSSLQKQKDSNRLIYTRQKQDNATVGNFDSRISRVQSNYALSNQFDQAQNQQAKIFRLQREKSEYIKQVSKLRAQLQQVNQFRVSFLENQLQRIKTQNDEQCDETSRLKDYLKEKEKIQRDSMMQLKETKEEIDKKNTKIISLENEFKTIQSQICRKDTILQELKQQNKSLIDQMDDIKLALSNAQKKSQIQSTSYKEQLKKMSQKYAQSEAEKQKVTIQLSNLLNDMQTSQKKGQYSMKQKQKNNAEERTKLSRRLQSLEEQKRKLEEENQQAKQKISQLQQYAEQMKKKLFNQCSNGSRLSSQLNETISRFNICMKQRDQLQKSSKQLQTALEDERLAYKKKHQQMSQELSASRSQLLGMQLNVQSLTQKNQQLQQSLSLLKSESLSTSSKVGQMQKKLQQCKKDQLQKQRIVQKLTVQNANNEQKINNLMTKLQQQKLYLQTAEQQYETQITYLEQAKSYLDQDISHLRQALERQTHKSLLLEEQIKKLNEQVLQLNRQLLQFVEKENSLENKNKELAFMNETNLQKLNALETKNSQLKAELTSKSQILYKLQKSHKSIEQQHYLLEQKAIELQKTLRDRSIVNKQGVIERQKKLNAKSDQFSLLRKGNEEMRSTILGLKAEVNQSKMLLKMRTQEKDQLKEQNQKYRLEIERMRQELDDTSSQLTEFKVQIDNATREISSRQSMIQSLILSQNSFKASTVQAMRQLFEILSMDQSIVVGPSSSQSLGQYQKPFLNKISRSTANSQSILNSQAVSSQLSIKQFPDEQLCSLQLQLITCRNQIFTRYNQAISSLQNELATKQSLLQKEKQILQQRDQQHQEELFCQKERLYSMVEEKQLELNELHKSSKELQHLLEDSSRENQQLHNQIAKIGENVDELQEQLRSVTQEKRHYQQELQIITDQLQKYKQNQSILNEKYEQSLQTINSKFTHTIQAMKASSSDIQQQYLQMTREMLEKQNQMHELINELQKGKLQVSSLGKFLEQSEKIILQYEVKYEERQKLYKEQTSQLSELYLVYEKIKNQLQNTKHRLKEHQGNNSKLLEEIHQLKMNKEKIQFQFRQISAKCHEYEKNADFLKNNANYQQQAILKELKSLQEKYNLAQSQKQLMQIDLQRVINSKIQLEAQVKSLSDQNLNKKQELLVKQEGLSRIQIKIQQIQHGFDQSQAALQLKQQQLFTLKQSLQQIEQIASKYFSLQTQCQDLQYQLNIARQELFIKQSSFQTKLGQTQQALVEARKQISFKSTKEQEQRRRIRDLESMLQQKENEIAYESNKAFNEGERERLELLGQVNQLEKQLQNKCQERAFEKETLEAHLEEKSEEVKELTKINVQNQHLIVEQQKKISQQENIVRQLENKLQQTLELWSRQKSTYHPTEEKINNIKTEIFKFQKFSKNIDAQSRQLIEIAKRKSTIRPYANEGEKSTINNNNKGISDILREVGLLCMRTKTKLLGRCQSDKDKQLIISDYRLLQQKLENAMKSHAVMKPIGLN